MTISSEHRDNEISKYRETHTVIRLSNVSTINFQIFVFPPVLYIIPIFGQIFALAGPIRGPIKSIPFGVVKNKFNDKKPIKKKKKKKYLALADLVVPPFG